ncbi:MAG: hypothetical protein M1383_00190 [Patescibacteria group bacterium]|nr:hypothetical protein [Patescibacteria group bacterium]
MNHKRIIAVFAVVLGLSLSLQSPALAANVAVPITANISSDSVNGTPVSLPALTISENAPGDIPASTLVWVLPSGFAFDTASAADVAFAGTNLSGSGAVSFPDSTHFSVTVTATSTAAGSITIGSTIPLRVKVKSGTPLAPAGNILLSSGEIAGFNATSSFGTLAQVAGAANKLFFSIQPPATANTNSAFSAALSVKDQFGNVAVSDSGRTVSLSVIPVSPTTTAGYLNNAIAIDNNGNANFSALSFSATGTIQLLANASGLASTTSNNITFSNQANTTTPPVATTCDLHNGILVKIGDSPTVYMVVNCVLRPFTSAAIFHAKGKKFENIRNISSLDGAYYGIGRPIGQGSDDDSTIIIPPTMPAGTTTPPSLSGLPDGSVVKIPGNPTVYLVSGGVLQPFTSQNIFYAHKKKFSDIRQITPEQFISLTLGSPATFPDGTLLKGPSNTVYVVKDGQLYGITSMTVFNRHGWKLNNVLQVQQQDLNTLSTGGIED